MDSGIFGIAAGAVAASGFMAYAVRGRSSRIFGESYYHGDRSKPALALTFDDGPSESTPKLLEALDRHQVSATFFMCGENVRRCPDVAREVASRGHEIGNHTDSHRRLDFKSPRYIYGEMARAQETIQEVTGAKPRWFRAPYGVRWFGVAQAQELLGLNGVMWTVIGRDWKLEPKSIVRRVLPKIDNGAIVCLHDGRELRARPDVGNTIEAVRRLIPILKAEGYRLQTVSQLICPTN
jgi:peptidoglycan-N-acetylglucosamine deacetylase